MPFTIDSDLKSGQHTPILYFSNGNFNPKTSVPSIGTSYPAYSYILFGAQYKTFKGDINTLLNSVEYGSNPIYAYFKKCR